MDHQVFVSHATEDLDTARQVCKILEAEGISCWLATRDVEAGTDYAAAILDAIKNSQLVLLIFSKHANASPYVLREIERAIAYDRPVLSLRLDDSVPNASMEYYLNLWQWLDAHAGVEKQRREIVAAVREQLDRVASPAASPEERPKVGTKARITRLRRHTRRAWGIAIAAAILVAAAAGVGLWEAGHHQGAQASSNIPTTTVNGQTASSNGPARSHNTWIDLNPKGGLPPGRTSRSLVLDPTSGRLIMFGGQGASGNFNDTWAYDPTANAWADLSPTGELPSARAGVSMVYVPSTRTLIMFGGWDGSSKFNDTWAYDPVANTWTNLKPSGALPSARYGQSLAYDPSSRRVIMFGGQPSDGNFFNDTWAYDPVANTWTNLRTPEPLPPARLAHSMVYDPSSRRVIIFGGWGDGRMLNDTWAYDPGANGWSNLNPSGTLPYARYSPSMVCDSSNGLLIMFGGGLGNGEFLNDTWAYDPRANAWTKLSPSGTLPSPRGAQSMVFAPSSGQVIMFGGGTDAMYFNDTWSYTP